MGIVFDEVVGTVSEPPRESATPRREPEPATPPADPERWRREARHHQRRAARLRAE